MAYSPVDHARLPKKSVLDDIAAARGVSTFQIALAWLMQQPQVCSIPKASNVAHLKENRAAAELELSVDELAKIDAQFKPPKAKRSLEML